MAVDTKGEPGSVGELPERVVEDVLASERRRALLACLADHGEMAIGDLAAEILAREGEDAPADVDGGRRAQVRTDIFQTHLPKLTATGIVTYDSLRGTVALSRPEILRAIES
jgi:DNA-binding transcriptional ArsR family regulator